MKTNAAELDLHPSLRALRGPTRLVPDAHPDELDDLALASEVAPDLLRDVILPQDLLASRDCLDVYRLMFLDRVEQLLVLRLPAVHDLLGDEHFGLLVRDYVTTWPAGTSDLARVGDDFHDYLARSRELDGARRGWMAELARLEDAIARSALTPSGAAVDEHAALALTRDDWEHARFEPAPALRLLAFDHRIDALYSAWQRSEPVRAPERRPQHLAVLRQGAQVQRAPMTRRAWGLLRALCSGRPLAAAVVEELGPGPREHVERRARPWITTWITNGFFQTVHPS